MINYSDHKFINKLFWVRVNFSKKNLKAAYLKGFCCVEIKYKFMFYN